MLAACNSTAVSANGSELEPPLANRVLHLAWEDDHEGWERAMLNGGRFAPPQFIPLPDDWEEHLPKYSALVAAFHKHLPGRLKKFRPSGASCGTVAQQALLDQRRDLHGRPGGHRRRGLPRYEALTGCVGEDVALEYQNWERLLDLPDPEGWLGWPSPTAKAPSPRPALAWTSPTVATG